MKELRPPSAGSTEVRLLFAFDPAREAIFLEALGVSQARISKIEHGEIAGIDTIKAYVTALGGTVDVVVTLGDRTWKVARGSVRNLAYRACMPRREDERIRLLEDAR